MSNYDPFYIPGSFEDNPDDADAAAFHIAGEGFAPVRFDPRDIFPDDTVDGADTLQTGVREHLPQFGPPFVRMVWERFDAIDAAMKRAIEKWSEKPTTVVLVASMNTDGSGNINRSITGNSLIAEPPVGFTLAIHRLSITNTGNTFGVPFNAAGGYWELRANDEFLDGASLVTPAAGVIGGQLPVVKTWGTRDAPHVRDGEVLSLFMNAGPVSQKVTVKIQGTYERTAEG